MRIGRTIELPLFTRFVKAAAEINEGKATAADFDVDLPTGQIIILNLRSKHLKEHTLKLTIGRVTEAVTAILEAGRRSLDAEGATVKLLYNSENWQKITDLQVAA